MLARSWTDSFQNLQTRFTDWKQSTKAFRQMRNEVGGQSGPSSEPASPVASSHGASGTVLAPLDQIVPSVLQRGEPVLKVTQSKVAQRVFWVDTEYATIEWDSKRHNKVPLYAIRDVRVGAEAQSYRQALQIAATHEPLWISVIYQTAKTYKAVHLIMLSPESMQRWCATLLRVVAQRQALLSGRVAPASIQSHWLNASWEGPTQSLSLDEVIRLCQRTGIQCSQRELRVHFEAADKDHRGMLDFEAFQQFVATLKRRPDIEQLFRAWADDESMDLATFGAFVRDTQGEVWDDEQSMRVFARYAPQGEMTYEPFLAYLSSRDNAPFSSHPARSPVRRPASGVRAAPRAPMHRDEDATPTHPLSDYFISSSHNTYLVGGQWKGDSTVEGYVRALQQGARSVELDCWDGPNGQPQVTHGRTLTGKVPFSDVVEAVAQYAFVSSPYPLILSMEVHNDVAQQEVLASILQTRLGGMLVTEPLPDTPPDTLPSPSQLRGRVLVKFKDWSLIQVQEEAALALEDDESTSTTDATDPELESVGSPRGIVRQMRRVSTQGKPKEVHTMAPVLAALLVYTVGVRFRGINKKEQYAPEHMFSLSERKLHRLVRQNSAALVKHNVTHLTRVYPSLSTLSRVHSSANFLPVDMWAAGCQLVALNWQTRDRGMEMNQAFFAQSIGGYRLKPPGLRVRSLLKNGEGTVGVALRLTIVSAQQLPIAGREEDETRTFVALQPYQPSQWGRSPRITVEGGGEARPLPSSFRTHTTASGIAPVWNAACTVHWDVPAALASHVAEATELTTATRGLLDLCFLRLEVLEEQQGTAVPIASCTANLGTLCQGYRHLPLYDTQLSRLLYATLFVHTTYTLERTNL